MFKQDNDAKSAKFSVEDYTKLCENKAAYVEFFTQFVIDVSKKKGLKPIKEIMEITPLEIDRKFSASDEAFILMILWNEALVNDSEELNNDHSRDDMSTDSGNKTVATTTSSVSHCKQKKDKGTGTCGWDEVAIEFYKDKKKIIEGMRSDISGRRHMLELIKRSVQGEDISSMLSEDHQVTMDNSNSVLDGAEVLDSVIML